MNKLNKVLVLVLTIGVMVSIVSLIINGPTLTKAPKVITTFNLEETPKSSSAPERCLTWDGTHLWYYDFDKHQIYKVEPKTGKVVYSIRFPTTDMWWFSGGQIAALAPTGLVWDGNYLWFANGANRTIYQLNPHPIFRTLKL